MAFVVAPKSRYQAAIFGRVLDARTGAVVPGVLVSIAAMPAAFQAILTGLAVRHGAAWGSAPGRPDLARTSSDGVFHFGDLPDGSYELSFSVPGGDASYGSASATALVSHAADGTVTTGFLAIDLPPTGAQGLVLREGLGGATAPLPMALVRVRGSGESAHCDASGQFYLTGADPGSRVLEITAPGCLPAVTTVSIQKGVVSVATTVRLSPAA